MSTVTEPAVTGPDFIALQVRDLDASARFYTDILGLRPAPQSPSDAIVFQTKPIPFAIRKPLVDLSAASKLGWGVALWMHVNGTDALYEKLRAAGVPIVREPTDSPFGRTFTFADPDGYGVTVHDGK